MKLRILFLTNRSPFPIIDGQTRRTYNILKGLAVKHDIHLLSLYQTPEEIATEHVHHLESFCKSVEMVAAPSKTLSVGMAIRVLRSLFSLDPYTVWRHYSPLYLKQIKSAVNAFNIDLVHCDILSLAYAVRPLNGLPCTMTDHDVCYRRAFQMARQRKNLFEKTFLFLEGFKLKRLEARIFKRMDMGIAVSEQDKTELEKICPGAVFKVVENGVDTELFEPGPQVIEENTLVWVGGFGYYPNKEGIYYFLNEIYPKIKVRTPRVKLKIVGGGVTERLRAYAAADASIEIFGFVESPLPFIQRAAVFVAPLLSGGGTKLKVLEAMSVGKAIVSTSVGVEGIEGADKEHFLVADTPDDFSEKVADLLKDKAMREFLGSNARTLAKQKYDWKNIWLKSDEIYQDLFRQARTALPVKKLYNP
jgi:glycosyltransferase involved in cell wall biosynthesis